MKVVCSLNYAPGLFKEMLSISTANHQEEVELLISHKYSWMTEGESTINLISGKSLFAELNEVIRFLKTPTVNEVIFYNISTKNILILAWLRLCTDKMSTLVLHEPFKPTKWNGTISKGLYFLMAEWIQKTAHLFVRKVILVSPFGHELYKKGSYIGVKKEIINNLPVPDVAKTIEADRLYFTIVGRFNVVKKIDYFLKLVEHCATEGYDFKFRIVTSSDISRELNYVSDKASVNLEVINPSFLSDEVINESISASISLILLQEEVTQSGVLPQSLMLSTPIIAPAVPGISQYIRHDVNGVLIDDITNHESIVNGMIHISKNIESFSSNARNSYIKTFKPDDFEL